MARPIFDDPTLDALATAVFNGEVDGVAQGIQAALGQGLSLDTPAPSGLTLLLLAMHPKSPQSLQMLLQAGANPMVYSDQQTSAPAAASGRDDGTVDHLQVLLDHGVNPDVDHGTGQLPLLYYAIMGNNRAALMLLLTRGANVNAVKHLTGTALHVAMAQYNFAVAKILLQHGADARIATEYVAAVPEEYCRAVRRLIVRKTAENAAEFADLDAVMRQRCGVGFACAFDGSPLN